MSTMIGLHAWGAGTNLYLCMKVKVSEVAWGRRMENGVDKNGAGILLLTQVIILALHDWHPLDSLHPALQD